MPNHPDNQPLPDDWIKCPLGEVCNFVGGGTPSKGNPSYWNGDVPWASIKDVKGDFLTQTQDCITEEGLNQSAANIAETGEIILATRINPGRPIISKIRTAINQDLKIVKPKIRLDVSFLYHSLRNIEKAVLKVSSGTTVLGVNLNNLREVCFPLAPLPEQRAIVAKIEQLFSELDNGIENLKTARAKLDIYRQAVLKKAFEGDWPHKRIKDVCDNVKVGVVIKPKQYYSSAEKGVYAFRSANVREFRVDDSAWVYFSKEGHEANRRTQLKKGDVLIVRSGYPGTSCVVPERFAGANAIDILIATPDTDQVTPEYLCAFNNSPLGKGLFSSGSRGVAQKHLNVGVYGKLGIPVPPLPEQHQIVQEIESRLSVCDKLAETIDTSLQQAESLRQSILKKAFTGQLLTPAERAACRQQPDYRPAAELAGKRLLDKKMGNVRKVGGFQG